MSAKSTVSGGHIIAPFLALEGHHAAAPTAAHREQILQTGLLHEAVLLATAADPLDNVIFIAGWRVFLLLLLLMLVVVVERGLLERLRVDGGSEVELRVFRVEQAARLMAFSCLLPPLVLNVSWS